MTVIIPNVAHFMYCGNDFQAQVSLSVLGGSLKIMLFRSKVFCPPHSQSCVNLQGSRIADFIMLH